MRLNKGILKLARSVYEKATGDVIKTMPEEQVLNMMFSNWRDHVFGEGKETEVLFINKPMLAPQLPNRTDDETILWHEDDIFAYSGYIKPGKHQIIIHDPESKTWYEINNFVIDPREGVISTHKE